MPKDNSHDELFLPETSVFMKRSETGEEGLDDL